MPNALEKVALVTGGASGFGRATALQLAADGFAVAIADVDEASGHMVVEEICAGGGSASLIVTDISTAEGAEAAVRAAVNEFGSLTGLVNNAGISGSGLDLWGGSEEVWDRVIQINLKSVYLCTKYAVPVMAEHGGGSIANVSSIAALSAVAGPAYGAAKAGMLGYTLSVAPTLAGMGIRINCVCPGYMDTPMARGIKEGLSEEEQTARLNSFAEQVPFGRIGEAREIADAICYLLSEKSSYMTGQHIVVDASSGAESSDHSKDPRIWDSRSAELRAVCAGLGSRQLPLSNRIEPSVERPVPFNGAGVSDVDTGDVECSVKDALTDGPGDLPRANPSVRRRRC
jgi:NAD(P)-dependent dehydrogenase (short-subunit alcohol dehydrogenase family)